jgi:glycosyltransferase involved in cell wall biosynthesis
MIEARDIYNSEERYFRSKEKLRNNKELPIKNRNIAIKWLDFKEKEIINNIDKQDYNNESKRFYLTLIKYTILLTNICYWFPDLKNITKKDLDNFKISFNQDEILSLSGKVLKCKTDYYNKIIKSHFFKKYLGYEKIVNEVFDSKIKKEKTEVEFINIDDLNNLLENCRYISQRVIFSVLFTSGLRIGEFLNIKKKENIIITISRLNVKTKNTPQLIYLIEKINNELKNWKIVFIGDYSNSLEINRALNECPNAKKKIQFTGTINNREELFNWYRKSKIFIFPSTLEGFANVLVEAAYFKCGIVSFNIGGSNEITNKGKYASICNKNDYECFKKAIINYIKNKSLLEKHSNLLHNNIIKNYMWSKNVDKLYNLIIKIKN